LKHNQDYQSGLFKFKVRHNLFGDLCNHELKKGFDRRQKNILLKTSYHDYNNDTSNLPEKVDWRDKGIINPIQNQLSCGSCYAFSG
jgi:C1A family cysteine protease